MGRIRFWNRIWIRKVGTRTWGSGSINKNSYGSTRLDMSAKKWQQWKDCHLNCIRTATVLHNSHNRKFETREPWKERWMTRYSWQCRKRWKLLQLYIYIKNAYLSTVYHLTLSFRSEFASKYSGNSHRRGRGSLLDRHTRTGLSKRDRLTRSDTPRSGILGIVE